jgi:hypothetical protein
MTIHSTYVVISYLCFIQTKESLRQKKSYRDWLLNKSLSLIDRRVPQSQEYSVYIV